MLTWEDGGYKYVEGRSCGLHKVRKMEDVDVQSSIKYLEDYLSELDAKVKKKGIEEIEDGIVVKPGTVDWCKAKFGNLLRDIKENGVPKRNGVPACASEEGHILTSYGYVVFWDDI